jgi:hypothetical protein
LSGILDEEREKMLAVFAADRETLWRVAAEDAEGAWWSVVLEKMPRPVS